MNPIDLKTTFERLRTEANKVLVGLEEPFELLAVALFTGGHVKWFSNESVGLGGGWVPLGGVRAWWVWSASLTGRAGQCDSGCGG